MATMQKRYLRQSKPDHGTQQGTNHGAFYYKRFIMAKMGREYRNPLAIFRSIRTKQDMDRPDGATDMFFRTRRNYKKKPIGGGPIGKV